MDEATQPETSASEAPGRKRARRIPFDLVNRRTHLYAAMFFMPWFLMYGMSSAVLNHPRRFGAGPAQFNTFLDRTYDTDPVPPDGDLNASAKIIEQQNSLEGNYVVERNEGNLLMVRATFWSNTQISYDFETHHLHGRTTRLSVANTLTSMHERGGFNHPGAPTILWSVIVDIVQISIIIWLASGLYMWWHLKFLRNWGWLALAAGCATFALFLLKL
jgi:hypothetical protein